MDLLAELAKRTDVKKPSEAATKAWDFSEKEADTVQPNNMAAPIQPTENQAAQTQEQATNSTLDKKEIQMSAEASQAGVEFLTTLVGELIIEILHRKKFTADQLDLLQNKLLDAKVETLTEEEQSLLSKYNRLTKTKDKKIKKLEQSEKSKERMVNAFAKYSEITGKTFMSPGLMLGIAISENVVKTVTSVVFD